MGLLKLRLASERDLKVVWTWDSWEPEPYYIGEALFTAAVEALRRAVEEMSLEFKCARIQRRPIDLSRKLTALSRFGAVVLDLLLDDPRSRADTDKARFLLESLGQNDALTIYSDVAVTVPWGFVALNPTDFEPNPTIANLSSFLLSKNLSVRYKQTDMLIPAERPRNNFKALLALNMKLLTPVLDNSKKALLTAIKPVGAVANWNEWEEQLDNMASGDGLIYVYGHSDGEVIVLGENLNDDLSLYKMTLSELKARLSKCSRNRSATFFIFNGCYTGTGFRDNSLLAVTSRLGLFGFIGTEAEVTNEFAAEYGHQLLELLWASNFSVGEAFNKLQRELFPESLLYTCFADRAFRIEKPI
ncbi:hypothetical protein AB9E19_13220 [Rhizobium leguminosarum]|uniref:hypothetical protein n=1 Tax=Rhizobium leguminosarum TaxID=384 RepID=UPI003F94E697